jgi:hypothetical protein
METYIHTLIAADTAFVPTPAQVTGFFDELVSTTSFKIVAPSRRFPPGPVVMKPNGLFRTFALPSGKTESIPRLTGERPDSLADIPRFIEDAAHYRVSLAGQWQFADTPLVLFTPDKERYEDRYLCSVNCECRPEPVSTSAWDCEAGPNVRNVPFFGAPCEPGTKTGIFPNPWTGEVIEVAEAGCARFWIEFEFGDFLFPDVTGGLQIFNPMLVSRAEQCFKTRFAQGCHFY